MANPQTLTSIKVSPIEIRDCLMRSLTDKCDTGAGKYALNDMLNSGWCYRINDAIGRMAGAFVVRPDGTELWVLAAAGDGPDGADMTAVIAVMVEQMARTLGYKSVGFQTARKGLQKKSKAHGYETAGYIMRKKL